MTDLILSTYFYKDCAHCTFYTHFAEWGKFYPKKVIQKVEVKLSTEISHVNFFIQKFYPKTFLSKINVTYSTLLYKQKAITQTSPNYST